MTNRILFLWSGLGPARAPQAEQAGSRSASCFTSTGELLGPIGQGRQARFGPGSRAVMARGDWSAICPVLAIVRHRLEGPHGGWCWMGFLPRNVAQARKPSPCCSKKLRKPIESVLAARAR